MRRGPAAVVTALAGLITVALLALGLRSGGVALVGVAGLLVILSLAVIGRIGLARAGLFATCGFVFTCSWTAWYVVGHQRPRALFLFLALALLVAAQLNARIPRAPWWYWAMVVAITVDGLLDLLFPTSAVYLNHRYLEIPGGSFGLNIGTGLTDFGTAGRILLTIVGAFLVVSICSLHFRRAPLWIAVSYAAGAALSSWVAFSDDTIGTGFGAALTGVGFRGDRAAGFTDHPNILAAGNVYAIAIAAWLATRDEVRLRVGGIVMLLGMVLGTYTTRSRGGTICLVVAAVLCLAVLPKYRRQMPFILAGVGVVVGLIFVAVPGIGHSLLVAARLAGNEGPSDFGRGAVLTQGLRDFQLRPIQGIGLHVVDEAHNVLVQALASGGLILLFGFMAVQVGSTLTALALMRFDQLAAPLAATVVTGFVFGNLENTLTEPLVYVPVALVIGIWVQREMLPPPDDAPPPPAEAAKITPPRRPAGSRLTRLA